MSDIAIRVENLGKMFRIGARQERYRTFRDVLAGLWRRSGSGRRAATKPFWALKGVSFEIRRGEVVGVIGRNGAGKSTLLKVLSRITEPTEGFAEIHGRVGSLLEVGTGFHPELTGRENVFLNGAILGMHRAQIEARFDEIVAFAEIEEFLDTPVKHYSSGMYLRLAFAVAAHLEPEILVVDEVLAVGDAEFQKKCLGKMGEVSARGRTVLFVSHNMQAISTLTKRCLLLANGSCQALGPTEEIIACYLEGGVRAQRTYHAEPCGDHPNVTRVEVETSEPNGVHANGRPLRIKFEVYCPRAVRSGAFSFQIVDSLAQPVVHIWLFDSELPIFQTPGYHHLTCQIPKLRLYMGRFSIRTHLSQSYGGQHYETLDGICPFEVAMLYQHRVWPWQPGACRYLEEASWTSGSEKTHGTVETR
ncbi:MAG: polysaccharide ABC transporter ATP-binding protein [Limisphaerales bacterium]